MAQMARFAVLMPLRSLFFSSDFPFSLFLAFFPHLAAIMRLCPLLFETCPAGLLPWEGSTCLPIDARLDYRFSKQFDGSRIPATSHKDKVYVLHSDRPSFHTKTISFSPVMRARAGDEISALVTSPSDICRHVATDK